MKVCIVNTIKNAEILSPDSKNSNEISGFDRSEIILNSGQRLNAKYVAKISDEVVDIYMENGSILSSINKKDIEYDESVNNIEFQVQGLKELSGSSRCCDKDKTTTSRQKQALSSVTKQNKSKKGIVY